MLKAWPLSDSVPREMKRPTGKDAVASAVVATVRAMSQPLVQVLVSWQEGDAQHSATAIADTVAQVCVV